MSDGKLEAHYTAGYRYQLADDCLIYAPELATLVPVYKGRYIHLEGTHLKIKSGYAWDGPSGPTFDTKSFMLPSLAHDAAYQISRRSRMKDAKRVVFREAADEMLHRLCLECGMWRVRAWWVYRAVRRGGKSAADPASRKKVYVSP